ncbi:cholinesterase-like [Haemaphysalis longicornis]
MLAHLLLRPSESQPALLVDHLGGNKRQVPVRCEASRGRVGASDVAEYLGIPYARLNGSSGRFAEATFVQYVPGMALRTGGVPACPQYPWSPVPKLPNVESTTSDDCLYLNIWRPGHGATSNTGRTKEGRCRLRPVVVMLHGGRFQFGGGGTYAFYDGARAAALWDAVVVVPAYRVGAFGFLNMRVPGAPGNVGLLDQELALKWVYRR